ncbi:MAG TPA: fumarylacetoacetate hydrolase family protein [Alphaproteobacteria bacterium]|jgi:2-keto-4-pentenoate hydratase/2-oxohepta-3-ene-1,7-dioic acid hydratase in catechol pathway|nr:fumarylacetoacetate hydrolase family protein [Alphaproteobacteria bacterium]
MRIATIDRNGKPVLAVRKGEGYVDLSIAAPKLPQDMTALLAAGGLKQAAEAADGAGQEAMVPAGEARYLPVVPRPPKILCCGLNYIDHAKETGQPIPDYPIIFVRFATTLVGHGQPMVRPRASEQYDYEAELAVVIGKPGRHIAKADALGHVAGYSCFNDGSLRDYQFKSPQWTMGKNFDATGGFGPELVTADELPDGANGLTIRCRLNGETVQDSNTNQHIFDVPTVISVVSEAITLEAGDVIIMGTPPGVGAARKPQLWMKGGDTCEIEIEGIGTLSNPIVDE